MKHWIKGLFTVVFLFLAFSLSKKDAWASVNIDIVISGSTVSYTESDTARFNMGSAYVDWNGPNQILTLSNIALSNTGSVINITGDVSGLRIVFLGNVSLSSYVDCISCDGSGAIVLQGSGGTVLFSGNTGVKSTGGIRVESGNYDIGGMSENLFRADVGVVNINGGTITGSTTGMDELINASAIAVNGGTIDASGALRNGFTTTNLAISGGNLRFSSTILDFALVKNLNPDRTLSVNVSAYPQEIYYGDHILLTPLSTDMLAQAGITYWEFGSVETVGGVESSARNFDREWIDELIEKIISVGETKKPGTVVIQDNFALPKEVLEALAKYSNVSLKYHCDFEVDGKMTVHDFYIKGSEVRFLKEDPWWYGPKCLTMLYEK